MNIAQEKDHALRVEDLQGEITQRDRHIYNLKEDSGKLQQSINHLNKEIDFKRQEIQKVKVETQNQIRYLISSCKFKHVSTSQP